MRWFSLPQELRHPALVKHESEYTLPARVADRIVRGMGTLSFVAVQSLIIVAWIFANTVHGWAHWDDYPFVLLNLLFSTQAAYASPFILMAANRQAAKDEVRAAADHAAIQRLSRDVGLLKSVNRDGCG